MSTTPIEVTERQVNAALNMFEQRWMTLPWAAQDALKAAHPLAFRLAGDAVWRSNARCTYAFTPSACAALLAFAEALADA